MKSGFDGELEPMLATEWNQIEPTTWEFTLREGVTFQDGIPMDADAVAGALNHLLEAPAPARAFNADVISAVKVTDTSTMQVVTPRPDAMVPLQLASPNTGILAPKAYEGRQIDIMGTCTGPFTVTDEAPQQSLTLEANDNYWGGDVNLDSAEVRFVVDGGTRATQLQSGEAQIAKALPVASLSTLEGDPDLEVPQLELPRTTVMLLNNSRPPFDAPLVRQALQHAVDPEAIVDAVYEGTGSPAVGPFGTDTEQTSVDLEEARALFDEAGVDPESLSIELIAYNDRPEFLDVAAVIQDELGQVGIDVKIRSGEYAAVEPDMLSGSFDAALLSRGYLVDVADPAGYLLSDWVCDGGYNLAHYCDPETDQMIEDSIAVEDADERNAAYQELAAKLQTEAANVFLLHECAVWGTHADVANFEPHPLDYDVLTADLTLGS